ncbi:hypothetical protein [Rhodococcoides yunnanense]|uniref:hypothetical protein n=1 Tax=Rhodococcoides yunnanense TaxID=278209 RepID=UPI001FEC9A63|nr:hypothetical protein [Rhodococcus yunnanensis]
MREHRGQARLRNDASTIIGMQSRGAYAVTGLFVAAAAVAMFGPAGGTAAEAIIVALLAFGAILLIAVPGDPLPRWWALLIAALPAIQVAVLLTVVDTSATQSQAVTTTVGSGAALCAFLCVRGRVVPGWAGEVGAFAVYWAASPDFSGAASTFVTCMGVMVSATFFAHVVRPAAASVYALREERARNVADKAAADAAQDERGRQLRRLDALARPVLGRIAESTVLDDAARCEALLVEATLRDSIRARSLDVPDIAAAARAARTRGVTVTLLDDGGLDQFGSDVADRIRSAVVHRLDSATSGSITARVHPPGRSTLATVVVAEDDHVERYEFEAPI